jgi:hypothetical protein
MADNTTKLLGDILTEVNGNSQYLERIAKTMEEMLAVLEKIEKHLEQK